MTDTNTHPAKACRPTKFTPETCERILKCIARGMPFKLAAMAASVTYQTFNTWRKQYPDFDEKVQAAVVSGIERHLERIENAAAAGDVRSSIWFLEHVHPTHFARNRIEVTGAEGQPLSAAVAIYLPQKDGATGGPVTLPATTVKEIEDGDADAN